MRGKFLLIFGILLVFAVGFFLGTGWRNQPAVPEKVVYYTTTSVGTEEEFSFTPEQVEKLKRLGFSTNLVPVATTLKGRKKQ